VVEFLCSEALEGDL
jgi:hypothetical protein